MTKPSPLSTQRGVVLIEAMVAILLFSVGVLAIAGLQASMIQNTSQSKFRAEAGYIAQQQIGLMWADPVNTTLANFPDIYLPPEQLPNGVIHVVNNPPGAPVGTILVAVGWASPDEATTIDPGSLPCQLPIPVAHCFVTDTTVPFNP